MNVSDKPVDHHIQKHIIGVLIHTRVARFSELRPPATDTNLFSYHLKALVREGYVQKADGGYTLSTPGLAYVDRVSLKKMNVRSQPKIITMLAVRDANGRLLLQKRTKQPYIDTWTLPYGKTHIGDVSIEESARRETREKLGVAATALTHAGDAYIRVYHDGAVLSVTLCHVFSVVTDALPVGDGLAWYDGTQDLRFAPAVRPLIGALAGTERFFAEIDDEWSIKE